MAKNPKKKTLLVLIIIILLGALGYLAYNYRDLLSQAAESDVPTLPSSDALGSVDITPFPTASWNLVAYPYVPENNTAPTFIPFRLSDVLNDTGKDLTSELSQVYDRFYKLEKNDTNYVQYNRSATVGDATNYNIKPGSGYWILVDEKDDTMPVDTLLDDYTSIINNSLKVLINTNAYTLIGNPYIDPVPLNKIKFTGKNINMTLSEAIDQNLAIVYTYDNDNFGEEFTKLIKSDSLEPSQGAAIITKVKEAAITFNKPDSSS